MAAVDDGILISSKLGIRVSEIRQKFGFETGAIKFEFFTRDGSIATEAATVTWLPDTAWIVVIPYRPRESELPHAPSVGSSGAPKFELPAETCQITSSPTSKWMD